MTDSRKLVDHQLRMIEIKRTLQPPGERPLGTRVDEVSYGPCVLLSRQCGSAGDEVARLVGEPLHWPVVNREIVEQIAQRADVRTQLVETADEHVRSRWSRLLHPIREREGLKPETYLYYLHEVVLSLGHHGCVIMVGRGAQYLLPEACALRVRVVESIGARARRVASSRQWSIEEATRFVQQCEAARAEFIRKTFHQDTTSSLNYDLVLNTEYLGVAAAVVAVLKALNRKLGVKLEPLPCAT
jgi:hypothetical protein